MAKTGFLQYFLNKNGPLKIIKMLILNGWGFYQGLKRPFATGLLGLLIIVRHKKESKLKHPIILIITLMTSLSVNAGSTAIKFNDSNYLHRWSKGTQHEFTPESQPDFKKWEDMITINYYKDVKDGEKLALIANNLLSTYKKYGAKVLRTNSIPRTTEKPAEHLIVVVFGQPQFIEFVQARLIINKGMGSSIVYSHRMYGKKIGEKMSKWLQTNGPILEKELMSLDQIPSFKQLEKLVQN